MTPTALGTTRRALVVSAVVHAVVVAIGTWMSSDRPKQQVELVDIEVAPEPPKAEALPEEITKPAQPEHAAVQEPEPDLSPPLPGEAVADAGVDAVVDAVIDAGSDVVSDAAPDAVIDAVIDAAPDAATDAGAMPNVAVVDDGGTNAAADGSGVATQAIEDAPTVASIVGPPTIDVDAGVGDAASATAELGFDTGSGSAATTDPAVDGAPTTAGTAANLLAYFPPGHVVTVLVRLDRLRDTEWAPIAEKLIKPMPDYHVLFGDRDAKLLDKFETLVISSPKPKDVIATTIVARTKMTRPALRKFLDGPKTPVAWSAAKGGLLGRRTGTLPQGDKRVFLSPFAGWFLLAQPADLGGLTAGARGDLDRIEATSALPGWLQSVRTIETESGGDKRGPAVVVTLGFTPSRQTLPPGIDIALGVKSVPTPERVSVTMELVPTGWLVRGNMRFGREADAAEFVAAVGTAQQRIRDSKLLSAPLREQHMLNAITGLSLQRSGVRVSYGTSISIADARALLAAAATALDDYFSRPEATKPP